MLYSPELELLLRHVGYIRIQIFAKELSLANTGMIEDRLVYIGYSFHRSS
jgi:hypothetical protein